MLDIKDDTEETLDFIISLRREMSVLTGSSVAGRSPWSYGGLVSGFVGVVLNQVYPQPKEYVLVMGCEFFLSFK
jgi:hypothetical protein